MNQIASQYIPRVSSYGKDVAEKALNQWSMIDLILWQQAQLFQLFEMSLAGALNVPSRAAGLRLARAGLRQPLLGDA